MAVETLRTRETAPSEVGAEILVTHAYIVGNGRRTTGDVPLEGGTVTDELRRRGHRAILHQQGQQSESSASV